MRIYFTNWQAKDCEPDRPKIHINWESTDNKRYRRLGVTLGVLGRQYDLDFVWRGEERFHKLMKEMLADGTARRIL